MRRYPTVTDFLTELMKACAESQLRAPAERAAGPAWSSNADDAVLVGPASPNVLVRPASAGDRRTRPGRGRIATFVSQHRQGLIWAAASLAIGVALLAALNLLSSPLRSATPASVNSSATPSVLADLPYQSEPMALSLRYPGEWVYQDVGVDPPIAVFAPSQGALLSTLIQVGKSLPASEIFVPTETAAILTRFPVTPGRLPPGVDMSSPASVRAYFASLRIGGVQLAAEEQHAFNIGAAPAADGTYLISDPTTGASAKAYIAVLVWDKTITLFVGACPEPEWPANRAAFVNIVKSIGLRRLP